MIAIALGEFGLKLQRSQYSGNTDIVLLDTKNREYVKARLAKTLSEFSSNNRPPILVTFDLSEQTAPSLLKASEEILTDLGLQTNSYAFVAPFSRSSDLQTYRRILGGRLRPLFLAGGALGKETQMVGNLLEALSVPELWTAILQDRIYASAYARAVPLPTQLPALQSTDKLSLDAQAHIAEVVFEATDVVIADTKAWLDRLDYPIVQSLRHEAVEIVDVLGLILSWLSHNIAISKHAESRARQLSESGDTATDQDTKNAYIDWKKILGILPRGPEAKHLLNTSITRLRSSNKLFSIDEAVASLPRFHDENSLFWPGEEVMIENFIDAIKISSDLRWSEMENRNILQNARRRLLWLLDSPLMRLSLSVAFLCFCWENQTTIGIPTKGEDNSSEALQNEIRAAIGSLDGKRVFLVLPADLVSKERWNDHQRWIEDSMGISCTIIHSSSRYPWLYSERLIDLDDHFSAPFISAAPTSMREETLGYGAQRESKAEPQREQPASAICPVCGSGGERSSPSQRSFDSSDSSIKGAPPLVCPACRRFNAKDWWVCQKHDKAAIIVPFDKVRCPDCILRHHEDPVRFPLSSISFRPGYSEPFPCPHCEERHRREGDHPIFFLDAGLIPFYENGVNGHDRVHFFEAARKRQLIDDCRCPNCGTLLVPVDHRHLRAN
jgi:hypothetical protein